MLLLIIPPLYIASNAVIYSDTQNHWAVDYIDDVTNRGIMTGTGTNTFSPSVDITRGSFALVLANTLGRRAVNNVSNTGLSDVASGKYYTGAAMWAVETGIMETVNSFFSPSDPLTRAEAAMAIVRFCRYYGCYDDSINCVAEYYDCNNYDDDEQEEIGTAIKWGFMSPSGGYFNPEGTVSRGEVCVIIHNLFTIHVPNLESTKYAFNQPNFMWVNRGYGLDWYTSDELNMAWYSLITITDNYGNALMNDSIISQAYDTYIDTGKVIGGEASNSLYAKINFQVSSESYWESMTGETRSTACDYAFTDIQNTDNVVMTINNASWITNKNIDYATVYISPYLKEAVENANRSSNDIYEYHSSVNIVAHELMHVLGFGHSTNESTQTLIWEVNRDLDYLCFYDYRAINEKYFDADY